MSGPGPARKCLRAAPTSGYRRTAEPQQWLVEYSIVCLGDLHQWSLPGPLGVSAFEPLFVARRTLVRATKFGGEGLARKLI